jgi:hypothetical protein
MVKRFTELTDPQQKNILLFLDKAQNHELFKLKQKFEIKSGRNLVKYRENVLYALMMEEIEFDFFIDWLNEIYLEGNNTLFVYEPDNKTLIEKIDKQNLIKKAKKLLINIYDVDVETITDIKLTNIKEFDSQIMFTFASPSYVINQKVKSEIPDVSKDVYLAYITIDFTTNQIILSMHPTNNLYSLCGIKKKKDWDPLSFQFINFFKKNILSFNSADPDWIFDALIDITEEYYDHNNPIINKKLEIFNKSILSDVVELIAAKEESFKSSPFNLRIKKAVKELYETQLIAKYGTIPKDTKFKVFLNESGKGATSFKADSRGKELSFADSYEIVKKMIEYADITSLGITYIYNAREIPYKVVKESSYFSLKRINTAVTEKEIVDNVLRQLKKYKPGEELPNSSGKVGNDERTS